MKTSSIYSRYIGPFLKKLFRNRNIIIVSEGAVKHYPMSAKIQLLMVLGTMGFLSWASYSTGSYFAAQNILHEKERKLENTALANRRMEEQYALLQRDLSKLQENSKDLSEYERFVMEQHSNVADAGPKPSQEDKEMDAGGIAHLSQNLLQERIDYLEDLVDQMHTEREQLVASIKDRTKDQISIFNDIIQSTGLSVAKLSHQPQLHPKPTPSEETQSNNSSPNAFANQGGPFIPDSSESFAAQEPDLFSDLDSMVKLGTIVRALPAGVPIKHAEVTSGFGRRVDPITHRWAVHKGMDFSGPENSKAAATSDGVVTFAGRSSAYGYMVEVSHGYGIATRYAHLKRLLVHEDQRVSKGDFVGVQGNTGRSTGTHLHYEVRFNQTALNPNKFVALKNVF